MSVLALDEDFHVHSAFSDDAVSTVAENVRAARERGLRTVCVADHVRRDTAWVPELAAAVAACRDQPGPRVLAGVEAKILDTAGRLDVPPDLDGIDLVLIADHQFPADDGPVHPDRVRAAIDGGRADRRRGDRAALRGDGQRAARDRAAAACSRTCSACCPRSASTRPWCPGRCSAGWRTRLARAGAMVEVNEKWSCPSPRIVAAMLRAGVPLVAGSDSHHCRDVGVYRSVRAHRGRTARGRADREGRWTGMTGVSGDLAAAGDWFLVAVVLAGALPQVAGAWQFLLAACHRLA